MKLIRNLSYINKSKKIIKEGVNYFHNRFYYDENWFMKSNQENLSSLVERENISTQQFFEHDQINKHFQDYYQQSSQRKDMRGEDIPEVVGQFKYQGRYAVFGTGNDYQIIERTDLLDQNREIVLDLNRIKWLKQYQQTLSLVKTVLSEDHTLIAFGLDLKNDEDTIWMIKKVSEDFPQAYREKLYGCANAKFTHDGQHLIYCQQDDKMRTSIIKLHKLGTHQDTDTVIYEEFDEKYYTEIQLTKDKKYFVILSSSKTINKIMVFKNDSKFYNKESLITLISEKQECLAYCQHSDDRFYILSNKNVYDFKIQTLKDDDLLHGKYIFEDFYQPKTGEVITEIDLFQNYLVLYIRLEAESYLKVIQLKNKEVYTVEVPPSMIYTDQTSRGLIQNIYQRFIQGRRNSNLMLDNNQIVASTITPGLNDDYDQTKLRFHLDSPLVYNQVYELEFQTRVITKLQDSKLSGQPFEREDFVCKKYQVPSQDGTLIPLTVVHHKDLKMNNQNKLLLFSYGAYGISQEVPFNIVYLSAIEKRWILAFAHIRGGNEKGHDWHQSATKLNKLRSIEDLLSCTQYLIAKGFTHPSLLSAMGSSAGATTLAAVVNKRPDLFKSIILAAPFLDMLGSLSDKDLPLTVSDYEEFGNPVTDPKVFDYIHSYSPYENLSQQVYPAVYLLAGKSDFRAPLWGVMKYAERFRRLAKESKRVESVSKKGLLLDIQEGGHYGNAGTQAGIEEWCRYMAFLEFYATDGNKEATQQSLTEEIDQSLPLEDQLQK